MICSEAVACCSVLLTVLHMLPGWLSGLFYMNLKKLWIILYEPTKSYGLLCIADSTPFVARMALRIILYEPKKNYGLFCMNLEKIMDFFV